MHRFNILAAATAAAICLNPGDAAAQNHSDPVVVHGEPDKATLSRRVPFGDLNLASSQDVSLLHQRVRLAVRGLCEEVSGPNPLFEVEYSCRKFAWRGARPQIARAIARSSGFAANRDNPAPTAISIAISAR